MGKGGIIDLPAVLIILVVTFLLSRGAKESARINNIMVIIKLAVIVGFIVVGTQYVRPRIGNHFYRLVFWCGRPLLYFCF